jgi:hypothetical protein
MSALHARTVCSLTFLRQEGTKALQQCASGKATAPDDVIALHCDSDRDAQRDLAIRNRGATVSIAPRPRGAIVVVAASIPTTICHMSRGDVSILDSVFFSRHGFRIMDCWFR